MRGPASPVAKEKQQTVTTTINIDLSKSTSFKFKKIATSQKELFEKLSITTCRHFLSPVILSPQ